MAASSGGRYLEQGLPEVDLEFTHMRVCPCGRRVASGLECYHGEPVMFLHPQALAELRRLAAGFDALPGSTGTAGNWVYVGDGCFSIPGGGGHVRR